jgi:hypothetical protein
MKEHLDRRLSQKDVWREDIQFRERAQFLAQTNAELYSGMDVAVSEAKVIASEAGVSNASLVPQLGAEIDRSR